ncbi:MAG: valyl-tRNA synthetase, partial [Planctomycetes bacterium DG_23]
YRCGTIIEPYLSLQWFVKMKPLAREAIKATEEEKVRFHPARWRKVYLSWLENVRDWCISRQIWWGHRIPAWYCESCERITVAREDPEACSHCQSEEIRQDTDVLDTWFSSALWPFSTLGWPEKTPELSYYYPTDVLVTARDIIYFWVARMVMMGLSEMDQVPFGDVYVHAFILDEKGRTMSKSLGNIVDPVEMAAKYGADAVRFSLILLTVEVQDVRFSMRKFEMGRNFANKVWNAARFLLMNIDGADLSRAKEEKLNFEDRWILSRLVCTISEVTSALEKFQFNPAASRIYEFIWHEFCDWYLEAIKPRLLGDEGDDQERLATLATSTLVLDHILRLLHPFMPFITEKLWQRLNEAVPDGRGFGTPLEAPSESLIRTRWPEAKPERRDQKMETSMQTLIEVVRALRNIRAETNIPPRAEIKAIISTPEEKTKKLLQDRQKFIKDMAGAAEVTIAERTARPKDSAHAVVGQMEIFVPLAGLLDTREEKKRLERRLAKLSQELATVEAKLSNKDFLAKAPAEVIQSQKQRKKSLSGERKKLTASLEALKD